MPVPPRKPFPGYKWRWASLTPSEGLNDPPVFLGVLRAMSACEGEAPSSDHFNSLLKNIEQEVKQEGDVRLSLARTADRNLIRNSGQYWKALGLFSPDAKGEIALTSLGRDLADGEITKQDFAALTIKTLKLPNPRIQQDVDEWKNANLEIKPLELILMVLLGLAEKGGIESAFLTKEELVKIVITLAGDNSPVREHVECLLKYREGELDVTEWPDCAEGDNDPRMAHEFLIFLEKYGFCELEEGKFKLNKEAASEVAALLETTIELPPEEASAMTPELKEAIGLRFVERSRKLTEVLSRHGQPKFRKDVLRAYHGKCILTGESLTNVLAAGHIVPVKYQGSDDVSNGLCLRTDIHILYDSGHIRILPDGTIKLSRDARNSVSYGGFPNEIEVPTFVSRECLEWREKYY